MLKVVDRFTTRDGKWEVDPRPYGLTKEAYEKYKDEDIPGKGGAAHIFVKVKPHQQVHFYTEHPTSPQSETKFADETGWVNFNLWTSSAYWPPAVGPWRVSAHDFYVAGGLGLPEGLHVSTFIVTEDVDDVVVAPPPSAKDSYLVINGIEVWRN